MLYVAVREGEIAWFGVCVWFGGVRTCLSLQAVGMVTGIALLCECRGHTDHEARNLQMMKENRYETTEMLYGKWMYCSIPKELRCTSVYLLVIGLLQDSQTAYTPIFLQYYSTLQISLAHLDENSVYLLRPLNFSKCGSSPAINALEMDKVCDPEAEVHTHDTVSTNPVSQIPRQDAETHREVMQCQNPEKR